ncbi:MAG: cupin domain-containing protein [Specibacter sp.]
MSTHFFPTPGTMVNAAAMVLDHVDVPAGQLLDGAPKTATAALGELAQGGGAALELGVWEMTPGTMSDVEADEVFIVLSGAATVEIEAFGEQPATRLSPVAGDVVQLREGMRTVWTVTETFRKIYLA